MNASIIISFFLKKGKKNAKGQSPIYGRVTITNAGRKELTTRRWVEESKWDDKRDKVKGNSEEAKSINALLETMRLKLHECHRLLLEHGKSINPEKVISLYNGDSEKGKSLLEAVQFSISRISGLVGKEYSKGTLLKYRVFENHLKKFIKCQFGEVDLSLKDLKPSFITDFDYYLKVNVGMENNTAVGLIKKLKRMIIIAITNEWIKSDPFVSYKVKIEKVDRAYLLESEILAIEQKCFATERLEQVKDVFLFACFTGLAFSDLEKLNRNHLLPIGGSIMIQIPRTKTGTISKIPLAGVPARIIDKYKHDPSCSAKGKLLPTLSNQKMNEYLKEIGAVCGIEKKLTSHVARHTFATLALSNQISIESVSKMLGHNSIRTTQIYARVLDTKILADMAPFMDKYECLPARI